MAGVQDDPYDVRRVEDGIWETIFCALPTDEKERKKEQERRRKFKEKLMGKHREELIIDSSYAKKEGKTYTNTLLATNEIDLWQHIIEQLYGEEYLQSNSDLAGGHKILFKKPSGERFLSFSFYPMKEKIMVQGNHSDLCSWIENFGSLCKQKDNTPNAHVMSDKSQHKPATNVPKHDGINSDDGELSKDDTKKSEVLEEQPKVVGKLSNNEPKEQGVNDGRPSKDDAQELDAPDGKSKDVCEPSNTKNPDLALPEEHSNAIGQLSTDILVIESTVGNTNEVSDTSTSIIEQCPGDQSQICIVSANTSEVVTGVQEIYKPKETSFPVSTQKESGNIQTETSSAAETEEDHRLLISNQTVSISPATLRNDTHDEIESPLFTSHKNTKKYASHRRRSRSFVSKKIATARESTNTYYMLRVKQRLDALDAIISGLQGGILALVNSVESHKQKTEMCVHQSGEKLASLLRETINTSAGSSDATGKPILDTLQNCEGKLAVLTERLIELGNSTSQLKRMGKMELMVENLTAQLKSDRNVHNTHCGCDKEMEALKEMVGNLTAQLQSDRNVHNTQCGCTREIGTLKELVGNITLQLQNDYKMQNSPCDCTREIEALKENLHVSINAVKQQTTEATEKVTSVKESVMRLEETCCRINHVIMKVDRDNQSEPAQSQRHYDTANKTYPSAVPLSQPQPPTKVPELRKKDNTHSLVQPLISSEMERDRRPKTGAPMSQLKSPPTNANSQRPANQQARNQAKPRRVLLMGDSTTKSIDKRHVLRDETISICRAATVTEAYKKMNTNTEQKKTKVIFCVGLNDLRQGHSVSNIVQDIRALVEETLYRHPQCYIYLCSILPVNTPEVKRDQIMQLNSELQKLEKVWEKVFYINTMTAFLQDDAPWALFENDHIHPSQKGVLLLMNTIRRRIEAQLQSFRTFTSKLATPSTYSYLDSLCHNIGENNVHKAAEEPCMPPQLQFGGAAVSGNDAHNQNNRQMPEMPHQQRRVPAPQLQLGNEAEHAGYMPQRQCAPAPRRHVTIPPMYPYPRYHPELNPQAVPWREHFPYQSAMLPTNYYSPEIINYYV